MSRKPASPATSPAPSSPPAPPAAVVHNCADLCTSAEEFAQPAPDAPAEIVNHQSPIPNSPSLSDAQLAAIELVLLGRSDTAVARHLAVHRNTIGNWKRNPAFRAHLQARRDELFFETSDRFRNLLDSSLDTLELQVRDRYAPTAHRAARTLLTLARIGDYIAPSPQTDPPP